MRLLPLVALGVIGLATIALRAQDEPARPVERAVLPIRESPRFANEPGWTWSLQPTAFRPGRFGQASDNLLWTGYSFVDGDGVLQMFIARSAPPGALDSPDRVVVFNAAGKRFLPERETAGGVGNRFADLNSSLSSLDPKVLAVDAIAYMGVERLVGPRLPPPASPKE